MLEPQGLQLCARVRQEADLLGFLISLLRIINRSSSRIKKNIFVGFDLCIQKFANNSKAKQEQRGCTTSICFEDMKEI